MSTEQNKALFRRFAEQLATQGNLSVIDELVAPDFVEHEQLPPGVPASREGVKQLFSLLGSGFPDLQITFHDMIAEGDKVVAIMTWSGTHKGEFMGIPATGKRVSFQVIDAVRIADGKLVEHWGQMDMMAMMQQVGAIPAPA
jgi:steroid delta-isomerase-like uncharacterized protein